MWADRLSYAVFILTIPPMSGSSRRQAVLVKLESLYPHKCERDHIRIYRNGRGKNSYIVCVFSKLPEEIKCGISALAVLRRMGKFSGTVYFITDGWIERLEMSAGSILGSRAERRAAEALPDELSEADAVFCPKKETVILKERFAGSNIQFYPVNDRLPFFSHGICVYNRGTKERLRLTAVAALCVCAAGFVSAAVFNTYITGLRADAEQQRISELRKKEEEAERERIRDRLAEVRQAYMEIEAGKTAPAYEVCSVVYSCLSTVTRIDNISIAGNTFLLDAYDTDALNILRRFEENPYVLYVKMSRTAQDSGREYFSLSGEITRPVLPIEQQGDDLQQIELYEKVIREAEQTRIENGKRTLSSFADDVRTMLKESSCTEEYMQYMQSDSGIDLECSVRASSRQFLHFLKESLQDFEFSAVRIKNNSVKNEVSAFMRIKSGIDPSSIQKDSHLVSEDRSIFYVEPDKISRVFYVPPPVKNTVTPAAIVHEEEEPPKQVVRNPSYLHYLGSAGTSAGKQYVFIKDTRTDQLYKLPVDSDEARSCTVLDGSRLEVRLDGQLYEVTR